MANKNFQYYRKDGTIWSKGIVDDETKIDYWEWYRDNGTIMRSGYFTKGVQSGEWITYDKSGKPNRIKNIG